MRDNNLLIVKCNCTIPAHNIEIEYSPPYSLKEKGLWWDADFIISYHLQQYKGFWSRLKTALQYLFKRPAYRKYGDFDTINLDDIKAKEIVAFLTEKINDHEKWKKENPPPEINQ